MCEGWEKSVTAGVQATEEDRALQAKASEKNQFNFSAPFRRGSSPHSTPRICCLILVGQLFPSIPALGGTFGRGWAAKQVEQVWEKTGRSLTWGRDLGPDPESRPTWEAAEVDRRWGNKSFLFGGAAPLVV